MTAASPAAPKKIELTREERNAARRAHRTANLAYFHLREKNWRRKRKGLPPLPVEATPVSTVQQDIDTLQRKIKEQTGMNAILTVSVVSQ